MADLSPRKQRVIAAILTSSTLEAAAAKAGVSSRTIRQWRRDDPDFVAALRAAEGDLVADAGRLLLIGATPAVNRLLGILRSGNDAQSARAAIAILDQAHKWRDLTDFDERLRRLENDHSDEQATADGSGS